MKAVALPEARSSEELLVFGRQWGGLMPVGLAARLAGVSASRMRILLRSGRVAGCVYFGFQLVGIKPLDQWMATRCSGRPKTIAQQVTVSGARQVVN